MSGRRKFGSVLVRSARDGHKYVQARYQPPVWAYSKWPDLPRHYTKNSMRNTLRWPKHGWRNRNGSSSWETGSRPESRKPRMFCFNFS